MGILFLAGPRGMMDPRMGMDPRMMGMMGGPGGPMGGPGGPCGGPPTSIQAQLEWQKMQQQFMQEKNKPGMMGPGNENTPCMYIGMLVFVFDVNFEHNIMI